MKIKYVGESIFDELTKNCVYDVVEDWGKFFVLIDGNGEETKVSSVYCQEVIEEQSSEYNGENLPPVGTKVMISYWDVPNCGEAIIKGYYENDVWFEYIEECKSNVVASLDEVTLEPIKSEKDKEIEKIDDVIDEWQDCPMMVEKSLAEHLYENGFRFVEEN